MRGEMAKSGKKGRQQKKPGLLLKKCSGCSEVKKMTEFHCDRKRSDGHSNLCKECTSTRNRIYRQKLRARIPEEIPRVKSKTCSKCGKAKSTTEFRHEMNSPDGLSGRCKECISEEKRSYYRRIAARRKNEIPYIETKRCPKCGEVKPVSEFHKAVNKVDGYSTFCKKCNKSSSVQYRNKVADREFEDIQPMGKKTCYKCKRRLLVKEFNFSRSSYDGLSSLCRECGKEYKKQYYEENYGEYYNRQAEYRQKYPERKNAYNAIHEATYKGRMIRPDTCSKCGKSGNIVAHYNDYNNPLDICWLCLSCDRQLHSDLRRREKGK
jgi:hypothetical protein